MTNATAAILVVSVIIFCCGLPIAYHAAKCGIDIDLLTRGAGSQFDPELVSRFAEMMRSGGR